MAQIVRRRTADGQLRYDVRTRINGRVATKTFKRRRDADAYATTLEADRLRGVVVDPRHSRVSLEKWSRSWLARRPDLRPNTRRSYKYLLERHILPPLGSLELGRLTVSAVRAWHAALLAELPAVAPKAYQVLRATLNTAVADGLLVVNPCKIKGAGQQHYEERPVASVAEVADLADAIDARWRAMVLLAYWCGLRVGELRALRRSDLDLLHRWVQVREQVTDVGGQLLTGPPKTEAGRRRVAIPPHVQGELEYHLQTFVGPEPGAYLFTGHHGAAPLPTATWRRAWDEARSSTGLSHLHLHDLRHAGNTLAAATGASTKELMARMGHASPRAALIYQHATSDRDQAIAAALSDLAAKAPVRRIDARDGRAMETGTSVKGSND